MNKSLQLVGGDIYFTEDEIVKGTVVIEGENIEEMYRGDKRESNIETIELDGKLIVPGFIDSHTHLLQDGIEMMRPSLSNAEGPEEVLAIVEEAVKDKGTDEVIIASDFDESTWKSGGIPDKKRLDSIAPQNPVVIRRVCGHFAVANSRALEKISGEWGGVDGETGFMKEGVPLNISEIFPPRDEEVREGLKKIIKKANSVGITSIQEIVGLKYVHFFEELKEDERNLNFRIYIPLRDMREVRKPDFEFRNTIFGGVKMFADGSIGARTAAVSFDYRNDPENRGILIHTDEEFNKCVRDAEDSGIQLIIHAIGDRAIGQVIDAFEGNIDEDNPLRHRIEHCELVVEKDMERMKNNNLIASMQPNFISLWSHPGGMYEDILGERYKMNNPIALLIEKGVTVAFGSDSMPLSPLLGIHGSVDAPFQHQRISLNESIECYTKNSAFAGFALENEGTIKKNTQANLAVLDRGREKVNMTIYRGRCVYKSF